MAARNHRLTGQQKFWLFGVGLPALLVTVSLVLIVKASMHEEGIP